MPKKRKITPEIEETLGRRLRSMSLEAHQICKDLKLLYNDGDNIRNKAVAISILVDEFEDQLNAHIADTVKWQED